LKNLASIALTAALAVGSLLSVTMPTMAAPPRASPATASDIVLVQEQGTRWHPDSYDNRRRWRGLDRRHWHDDRGWDRGRQRDGGWRGDSGWRDDRRYHRRHQSGVIFEIRP